MASTIISTGLFSLIGWRNRSWGARYIAQVWGILLLNWLIVVIAAPVYGFALDSHSFCGRRFPHHGEQRFSVIAHYSRDRVLPIELHFDGLLLSRSSTLWLSTQ